MPTRPATPRAASQALPGTFGDGNSATGATATHNYANDGTYTVTLTVTDGDGATDSVSQTLTTIMRAPLNLATTTIMAVGGNAAEQAAITDTLGNGAQDLSTAWNNDGPLGGAWFTLDLGAEETVGELHIATRGDTMFDLDIAIGNNLVDDQVSGGATTLCTTPGVDGAVPSKSHVCMVPYLTGRYITVSSTNIAPLTVHGTAVSDRSAAS